MDVKKQRVYSRHALHCIANVTYYEDTYSKHMLAVRIGKPNVEHYDLYIYECRDEVKITFFFVFMILSKTSPDNFSYKYIQ